MGRIIIPKDPLWIAAMSRKKAAAGGVSAGTLVLNHFNGSDGGLTFTDVVPTITWTNTGSASQLDTAQQKFGTASCLSANYTGGPIATGFELDISTGDWTLEAFIRVAALTGGGVSGIYLTDNSDVVLQGISFASYGSFDYPGRLFGPALSTDTWTHAALVQTAGDGRTTLYMDGMRQDFTIAANSGTATKLRFGIDSDHQPGWFDEVRFSNVARYTGASYTVPSSEFS